MKTRTRSANETENATDEKRKKDKRDKNAKHTKINEVHQTTKAPKHQQNAFIE